MFKRLKKYFPLKLRHVLVKLLPKTIRHSIIESYIDFQINELEKAELFNAETELEKNSSVSENIESLLSDKSQNIISNYWKNVRDDDPSNSPSVYANSSIMWDIYWLKSHIDKLLNCKGSILDFGCNAGRIMNVLAENGYELIGLDINPKAIDKGIKTFKILKNTKFLIGEGSEKLKEINQGSVDLIYTTSVLRHISPYSFGKVLTQFSRIKPRFIITLEDEASYTYRDFPHNYRKKFADLGWKLLLSDYAIDKKTKLYKSHGLGTVLRVYSQI